MAGFAGGPAAARGRRALDATLNLVPFIDLLSCCIAFLLITAVWTTVARVDVSTGGGATCVNEDGPPEPSLGGEPKEHRRATQKRLEVGVDPLGSER